MAVVFKFSEVGSTNDVAAGLLDSGHDEVIVSAGSQTAGRGRNNHTWEGAPAGNIYLSYGINHAEPPEYEELMLMQARGCMAVEDTLLEAVQNLGCSGNIFRLKYPNDVYAICPDSKARKISGTLVEHTFSGSICKRSVIGIGVNINQEKFSGGLGETATSLKLLGIDAEIGEITEMLCRKLLYYRALPAVQMFASWTKRLGMNGRPVRVVGETDNFTALEIMADGRLRLISGHGGERIIDIGDSIRYDII